MKLSTAMIIIPDNLPINFNIEFFSVIPTTGLYLHQLRLQDIVYWRRNCKLAQELMNGFHKANYLTSLIMIVTRKKKIHPDKKTSKDVAL